MHNQFIPTHSRLFSRVQANFIIRLANLMRALQTAGIQFRVTSSARSWEEQLDIWNSGRTRSGPVITHARPGRSPHNWGLAADFALFQNGLRIKSDSHPDAIRFQQLVEENFLATGRYWKGFSDPFHVQHPTWKRAIKWK